jgi:hypothetical protein
MVKVIIPFRIMENAVPEDRDKFINTFEDIRVDDKRDVFILKRSSL